jgi:hypothetical protein
LARASAPLDVVAGEPGPAVPRLHPWLDVLITWKHSRALEDPELFATYAALAASARAVVQARVDTLVAQLGRIIGDGITQGELHADDPMAAARAVFDATSLFHNPAHAAEWTDPGVDRLGRDSDAAARRTRARQ